MYVVIYNIVLIKFKVSRIIFIQMPSSPSPALLLATPCTGIAPYRYKMSLNIDLQLKRINHDLKTVIEYVNRKNSTVGSKNPVSSYT